MPTSTRFASCYKLSKSCRPYSSICTFSTPLRGSNQHQSLILNETDNVMTKHVVCVASGCELPITVQCIVGSVATESSGSTGSTYALEQLSV